MSGERTHPTANRKRPAAVWALALALLLLAGCGGRLQPVTTDLLDDAESRWQANPVLNYRLVAQVDRPGDVRRVEVLAEQGQIIKATVRYREKGLWGEEIDLSEKQARAFTVSGLFDMVRGEFASSGRSRIQVELDVTYSFPRRLLLGPVYQDGRAIPGTEAVVLVQSFEPLEVQE